MAERGFSYVELMVVVAILAIVAAIAIPSFRSYEDTQKLKVAALEMAGALRFGRSEATRTGLVHGVAIEKSSRRITVYQADISSGNPVVDHILYHPVDKKLYQIIIGGDSYNAFTFIINKPFQFVGLADPQDNVLFESRGMPIYMEDGNRYLLQSGDVQLKYGGENRVIRLQPETGRVTVQ